MNCGDFGGRAENFFRFISERIRDELRLAVHIGMDGSDIDTLYQSFGSFLRAKIAPEIRKDSGEIVKMAPVAIQPELREIHESQVSALVNLLSRLLPKDGPPKCKADEVLVFADASFDISHYRDTIAEMAASNSHEFFKNLGKALSRKSYLNNKGVDPQDLFMIEVWIGLIGLRKPGQPELLFCCMTDREIANALEWAGACKGITAEGVRKMRERMGLKKLSEAAKNHLR